MNNLFIFIYYFYLQVQKLFSQSPKSFYVWPSFQRLVSSFDNENLIEQLTILIIGENYSIYFNN